jgi:hypothetical protein
MTELGRLERVELRNIWQSEAQHFTPWLAREDNLALLADTLGIDLELEAVERNVGPFRADILCKDTISDSWVLIENQLERTDHTHLGQLMTYAAGLNAVTIVWIAARIADEHRAAMDWLNDITTGDVQFFALEVELWRIGDSPAAPKFNVVSKPNDWSRSLSGAKRVIGDISENPAILSGLLDGIRGSAAGPLAARPRCQGTAAELDGPRSGQDRRQSQLHAESQGELASRRSLSDRPECTCALRGTQRVNRSD